MKGTWRNGRGVAGRDQLREEVVRLLAVREAGERAVLTLEEHAREDQHIRQEARLTLAEPELPDRLDALRRDAVAEAVGNRLDHRKSSARRGSTLRPPRPPPLRP